MKFSKFTKSFFFPFCVIALFAILPFSSSSASSKEAGKLRVLFIGNSYTYFNNLPELLVQLSASSKEKKKIEAEMLAVGGATLKGLWEQGKAREAIQRGGWNYIVLQEQSTLGATKMIDGVAQINDPKAFHEAARLFDAEIKKAGAKTIFYLTWARKDNADKQPLLTDAYLNIGKELNDAVAPVGLAWQAALKTKPDFALHIADKSHPTPAGSYLAACVFYATIYGQSPKGLSAHLNGVLVERSGNVTNTQGELVNLSKEDAAFLQKIAWQTFQQFRK